MITPAITRWSKLDDLPEPLTVEEFGTVAALGRTAIYNSIRRGELEHVRFGKILRIPKSALNGRSGLKRHRSLAIRPRRIVGRRTYAGIN